MDQSSIEQEAAISAAEAKKIAALPVPKINNPQDLSAAQDQLRELDRVKRNIDKKRLDITRPHRLVITRADQLFKEPIDKLKGSRESLQEAIKAYQDSFKGNNI